MIGVLAEDTTDAIDATCEDDDSTPEHLGLVGICEGKPNILNTGSRHVAQGRG